jgi:hypothetical protein
VSIFVPYCGFDEVNGAIREAAIRKKEPSRVALLALMNH